MLHIIDHPLINAKLNIMRNEETNSKDFKAILDEIASLMTYEVFKDVKLHSDGKIKTPTGCTIDRLKFDNNIIIVPILRAGIGMSNGVCNMCPNARVGHIGLYRNEKTLEPVEYYYKMPADINKREAMIIDPMLATGGSSIEAIKKVKEAGAKDVKLVCLVGVQEGVDNVLKAFNDVDIYLASLDERLNEDGYIVPGLGDAGDRLFGTK